MTAKSESMMARTPWYYQQSRIFTAIQESIAAEYDTIDADDTDLQLQFRVQTATWGLKYWEKEWGITTVESDSYEIRRSRIMAAMRGLGNFGADLIENVCAAFINGDVRVKFLIPKHVMVIKFVGKRGIPPNLDDLKAIVDNLVHAHLGVEYQFTYLIWDELDAQLLTWSQLDAVGLTWNDITTWAP
jgi:hypothetical protein